MSRPLPELKDLHHSPEEAFKNDNFKKLLYKPPHATWIKKNKFANNSDDLPIDKVEFLFDVMFQEWKIEVLKTGQLLNAIEVTVRVHYKDPVTGEWKFHDGVGAQEIQTTKDSGVLKGDLSNISPGAIKMALPIAKSIAIKDAADHLGPLFGRDLNRKDTIVEFSGKYSKESEVGKTTQGYTMENYDL